MSDQKKSDPKKPVLDEQTLDKLLEAAFVIQEHGELNDPASDRINVVTNVVTDNLANKVPAAPVAGSALAASQPGLLPEKTIAAKSVTEKAAVAASAGAGKDAYLLTLAQIVETQQQILTRHLELESAMALVAQRAAEITRASGAAIGMVEAQIDARKPDGTKPDANQAGGRKLQYRAVSGLLTLARGSDVAMEKALCFNCLRSGEVIRGADVNSDFLLDAEECRRRGIGSLIAVPIYRDSGIAGALELYFSDANAFTEQDVHSCQLMAGLVTEALARDAGASSRKSLAAERATMLEALEKLRPNLAALMESPALKESMARSGAPAASASGPAAASVSGPVSGSGTGSVTGSVTKTAKTVAPMAATFSPSVPTTTLPAVEVSSASVSGTGVSARGGTTIPKKPAATAFFCRKCGHELVGEEMFCGKCGSPRTSEYQPPTMQSKLASMWQMQQASKPGKPSAAQAAVNGHVRPAERRNNLGLADQELPNQELPNQELPDQGLRNSGVPLEIQPWEAVLSELSDPFGEQEPEATQELDAEWKPAPKMEPAAPLRNEVIEISAAARKFSFGVDAPMRGKSIEHEPIGKPPLEADAIARESIHGEHESIGENSSDQQLIDQKLIDLGFTGLGPIHNNSGGHESIESDEEAGLPLEAEVEADAAETTAGAAETAALAAVHPLTWSSAAKVKAAFEQLAAAKNQNSFVRFWNTRRGDVYLAVAVVLVAGVIRWSMVSAHSFGANGDGAKVSHRRPAPDADLSTFDKLLVSLGLAEPPDPVEDKGNPDTQVWVDLHTALYYCPGADLYGKTPQGKYSSQRDAQLGQFEPAYRKACN